MKENKLKFVINNIKKTSFPCEKKTSSKDYLSIPIFPRGEVWIVGAGPGDPGLLTINAFHAIKQADIILYDALIDLTFFKYVKEGAILDYVGKRSGKSSIKQHEIINRLIFFARKNLRVLRLKGGDPFIFGRGGDEALALAKSKIPFRAIPGITAAIAASSYFGIPLTSRVVNQSVTFVTGHDSNGELPKNFDWNSIAKKEKVLVFYMAIKNFQQILEKLLLFGRDPNDPIAFISKVTNKDQSIIKSTLLNSIKILKNDNPVSPVIIIIGKVVNFMSLLQETQQEWHSHPKKQIILKIIS